VPEFVQLHRQEWLDYFASQGHKGVRPLAAGVEGAIYDLGDAAIAKVWRQRQVGELELMQRFYRDVSAAGLPFATPEIVNIEQANGSTVSYEAKLPGQPLQLRLSTDDRRPEPVAARCVIDVLQALASVPSTTSMRQVAVLDEDRPFWTEGEDSFLAALLDLLHRRAERFGEVIRSNLPDFDLRYACLRDRLAELTDRPNTVIHGDLFAGNIHVNADGHPLAVLDFGFLTTAGDPRFDAAIAANIMNMYAPQAPAITRELTASVAAELGYPLDILLVYQAAYAVATSNAFTDDGSDGHFAWCIAQLNRQDVASALGM
jgi:aminoglycoside phosphotransferase (APT) family kinase protein